MGRRRRIVRVTRPGQTTSPVEVPRRQQLEEGTRLVVEDRGKEIVLRRLSSLEDAAGLLSGRTTVRELNQIVDETRVDGD